MGSVPHSSAKRDPLAGAVRSLYGTAFAVEYASGRTPLSYDGGPPPVRVALVILAAVQATQGKGDVNPRAALLRRVCAPWLAATGHACFAAWLFSASVPARHRLAILAALLGTDVEPKADTDESDEAAPPVDWPVLLAEYRRFYGAPPDEVAFPVFLAECRAMPTVAARDALRWTRGYAACRVEGASDTLAQDAGYQPKATGAVRSFYAAHYADDDAKAKRKAFLDKQRARYAARRQADAEA